MSEIEEKRKLGIKFFEEKEFMQSYEIFSYIVGQDKNDHNAWFFLGRCERELNNYDEAVEHFINAIKSFLEKYPANEENKSNHDLRLIFTGYQNSLAVTYQYKKEWSKAIDLFFTLLKGQTNTDVLNSLGYTYNLMSEEELTKNKNANLAYIFDLQSLYFYEQADNSLHRNWRSYNQQLISEAKDNKIYSEIWEKDFIKKRKNELHQNYWYGCISYNLCQKSLHLHQYAKVLEFGVDALKNIGEDNHYFESIFSIVKEAKLIIEKRSTK